MTKEDVTPHKHIFEYYAHETSNNNQVVELCQCGRLRYKPDNTTITEDDVTPGKGKILTVIDVAPLGSGQSKVTTKVPGVEIKAQNFNTGKRIYIEVYEYEDLTND